MGKFSLLALGLLLLVLFSVPSVAGDYGYHNGYVHNGYTYNNGYWYKGGYGYSRSNAYYPTYYSNGYYYPSYTYYYDYTVAPQAPAYTPPAPAPQVSSDYAGDWKVELLKLAKQRDQFEGNIRKAEADQKAYLDAVSALGLVGNFRWQNYGTYPPHAGYGQSLYSNPTFGAQGNTVYGYSVNTLKEMYGETNMNTLYQQAARLTQNAQGLAGQGNTDFQSLVSQAGSNAGRVAELLAKAAAAKAVLESNALPPSSKTSTTTTILGQGQQVQGGVGQPSPMPRADDLTSPAPGVAQSGEFLKTVAVPLCGDCHGSKDPKGKFDIGAYPGLSLEEKAKVWGRLLTDDKDKRMPKDHPPLTPAQLQAFFNN